MDAFQPLTVLSFEEAATLIGRCAEQLSAEPCATEPVPLTTAVGRVLAEPVLADRDQPPLPRSTRDGFACRAADLTAGPVRVTGILRAGQPWPDDAAPLAPGTAIEIMTGAAVPPGADCVVMVEHVTLDDSHIRLAATRQIAVGDNIVPAGSEARSGDVIVPAGRRLCVAEIAAAAACGYTDLSVCLRPVVAILATGDELVDIARTPLPHQIRNSNSRSLAAQVAAAGGAPEVRPIVPDDPEATREAIAQTSGASLILLTGGVSMGKFDYVEQALQAEKANFLFTGVRMQPGKPVVFGKLPQTWFFGLPGNPISTMVTFALFAAPLVRALAGESETAPRFVLARLQDEVRVPPGLTRFLPARLTGDVHGARVQRIPWLGSGDLAAASRANAFLVVPESADRLEQDSVVSVLLL